MLQTDLGSVYLCFVIICCFVAVNGGCPIGQKNVSEGSEVCTPIVNSDVAASLNWMASPPTANCSKVTTVQGIAVCEDNIPEKCLIWSEITTQRCDDIGTLEFEKYWSKRCDVVIYHAVSPSKGNECSRAPGSTWPDFPRLSLIRYDVWGGKCYNCFYKYLTLPPAGKMIDVLKIQQRGGVKEEFEAVQYTVLSDLYLHHPGFSSTVQQVAVLTAYTPDTLIDR